VTPYVRDTRVRNTGRVTSPLVSRRGVLRLAALAGLLVLAGALPWITWGPLATRLVALPLLLVGALMAATCARLHTIRITHSPRAAESPACATCTCATAGVCQAEPAGTGAPPDSMDG